MLNKNEAIYKDYLGLGVEATRTPIMRSTDIHTEEIKRADEDKAEIIFK